MVASPLPYRSQMLILGASNVRRSLFSLVSLVESSLPTPVDIVIACGHGRSFGRPNWVLGWSLPGLVQARWNERWSRAVDGPRWALITDVGNDLLYAYPTTALAMWFESCLERIGPATSIAVVGLPMETVSRLGRKKFWLLKKIFFPGSPVRLEDVLPQARSIDAYMRDAARRRSLEWFTPREAWFGADPIHIRRSWMERAWREVWESCFTTREPALAVEPLRKPASAVMPRIPLKTLVKIALSRADQERWMGWDRSAPQPLARLPSGSTISFY